jgi:hypothetical protein
LRFIQLVLLIFCLSVLLFSVKPALGWSNGGYSADISTPDYGTHDWIAQHALDYLPANEKQYILDNLVSYLYGTELPDNSQASEGIGDTGKHHIYFNADCTMYDNASAERANEEYQKALTFLKNSEYINASKAAGTLSHYIVDVAVFGHVMGSSTPWGTEINHSNYENYVDARTGNYTSTTFDAMLNYDGALTVISAYNATVKIANNTTFDVGSQYNCTWMDANYNWSNPAFLSRAGESLNLAVNTLADVLHSLYQEANPNVTPTPTTTITPSPTPSQSPLPTPASSSSPSNSPTSTQSFPPVTPEYCTPQFLIIIVMTMLLIALFARKLNK